MSKEVIINQTKLSPIQGDITKQDTDAIVNAANPSYQDTYPPRVSSAKAEQAKALVERRY